MTVDENITVEARLTAVDAWIATLKQLYAVGDLEWDSAWLDLRGIAVSYIVRRQFEALDATILLAKAGMGHLAVGFVRPALDELLWMSWVKDLPKNEAQELLMAMGQHDGIRSLLAQRAYVGDAVMQDLWYPIAFLDAQEQAKAPVLDELRRFRTQLGWSGGPLPTAAWLAEQIGQKDLYDYLHAATSRALHFSMGEVMRHSWGEPGGKLVTVKPEFREYRASFALYQLPVLFLDTMSACDGLLETAGVHTPGDETTSEKVLAASQTLGKLGRVPLVHAHEWNLTPSGQLRFR